MIALLCALAMAGPEVDVTATLGMRAGLSATVLTRPQGPWVLGGMLTTTTDLYAFAPDAITWNLSHPVALHVTPMAAAGLLAPFARSEIGVLALAGPQISFIREEKALPALSEPAEYRAIQATAGGGMAPVFRTWFSDKVGLNTHLLVPLPLSPTGGVRFWRIHIGLGVALR